MAGTRISNRRADCRSVRGMTLVELIVVLAILAILASAGIGASVGYARRSIIEQNQSNAETIYQAAQTSLQQMQKAGGIYSPSENKVVPIDEWVDKLLNSGTAYAFVNSNLSPDMSSNATYYSGRYTDAENVFTYFDASKAKANESVHMRYVLTYSKKSATSSQSILIRELLLSYFNDASSFTYKDEKGNTREVSGSTVFGGTMTLEFDVEKSADAYGNLHLTAKCLSVFFDSRAKNGWASNASGSESDKTVPKRDTSYRINKSLIGYYDGYKGTAVDTVYLPKVQEGIVVKKFTTEYEPVMPSVTPTGDPEPETTTTPTPEPTPVTHTRLTWAATLDKENLVGSAKDVYYKIDLMNGTNVAQVMYLNEDFLRKEDMVNGTQNKYDYFTEFANGGTVVDGKTTVNGYVVTEDTYTAVYSDTVTSTVTKKSINVIANVYVVSLENDNYRDKNSEDIILKLKRMPLRISYVSGELDYKSDTDHLPKAAYLEYSLDLTGALDDPDFATVLTKEMTTAVITVYPNYFTDTYMKGVNDVTGIIPFKKGKNTEIDQEEAKLPDDTNTESSP